MIILPPKRVFTYDTMETDLIILREYLIPALERFKAYPDIYDFINTNLDVEDVCSELDGISKDIEFYFDDKECIAEIASELTEFIYDIQELVQELVDVVSLNQTNLMIH